MRIDFIDLRFRGSDGGIAPHAMRGEHGLPLAAVDFFFSTLETGASRSSSTRSEHASI